MGLAVGIMLLWHLWTVSLGETSVEAQDHEVYRKMARGRGDVRPLLVLGLTHGVEFGSRVDVREFV
jgi:hypothetical protein